MVNDAVGWAGLICVVIAGWTTANPTIYRAGLAFQGMLPAMPRTAATLLAGAVCIAAGIFPAFAMNLLSFVGLYGTVLAPVGAIIIVDHFLAEPLGIPRDPAAQTAARPSTGSCSSPGSCLSRWRSGSLWRRVCLPPTCRCRPAIACGLLYIVLSKVAGEKPQPAGAP